MIFAVPTYGGHASALYIAFCERGQAVFKIMKNGTTLQRS
ncbi:hypothetical protein ADU37_CDS10510 [Thermococcus sp. 2319x1]|nr:hypothetical protein ADU37_CDS10510 [Thermococcus sp. 2319x1]